MSTILVTGGGAGYIGSHAVKELLRQGHQPIVYDNLQTGHPEAVNGALLIEGDLSDQHTLQETFQSYPGGDVNSTLAVALVTAKQSIPLEERFARGALHLRKKTRLPRDYCSKYDLR